mmetsp:Transcript_75980/g.131626  ORF Transcript_75980/g.131626 Transcript_75980/m.131626 type:complete len:225 (+) Transcript_75980:706-1380(+)
MRQKPGVFNLTSLELSQESYVTLFSNLSPDVNLKSFRICWQSLGLHCEPIFVLNEAITCKRGKQYGHHTTAAIASKGLDANAEIVVDCTRRCTFHADDKLLAFVGAHCNCNAGSVRSGRVHPKSLFALVLVQIKRRCRFYAAQRHLHDPGSPRLRGKDGAPPGWHLRHQRLTLEAVLYKLLHSIAPKGDTCKQLRPRHLPQTLKDARAEYLSFLASCQLWDVKV